MTSAAAREYQRAYQLARYHRLKKQAWEAGPDAFEAFCARRNAPRRASRAKRKALINRESVTPVHRTGGTEMLTLGTVYLARQIAVFVLTVIVGAAVVHRATKKGDRDV